MFLSCVSSNLLVFLRFRLVLQVFFSLAKIVTFFVNVLNSQYKFFLCIGVFMKLLIRMEEGVLLLCFWYNIEGNCYFFIFSFKKNVDTFLIFNVLHE